METDTIFCALISLLLTTTFCVIFSNNTIYSALFLILSFMIGALLLFVIGSDFYALSIIIIYVGAVAVLVLFIIMMINTKSLLPYDFNEHINRNFYLWVIFVHFSTAHVVTYFKSWFWFGGRWKFLFATQEPEFYFDNLDIITILGQTFFSYYLLCFLTVGFILLIALTGSILLAIISLNSSDKKREDLPYKALSRTRHTVPFLMKTIPRKRTTGDSGSKFNE